MTGCNPAGDCRKTCQWFDVLCSDCALADSCTLKGLPKVTRHNRLAIESWKTMRAIPGWRPEPLTAKMREKLLLIDSEMRKTAEQAQKREMEALRVQQ